jgi:predicted  nucleic acid-binding Zn-ribbon protein
MNESWLTTITALIGYGAIGATFVILTNMSLRRLTHKIIPILQEDSRRRTENTRIACDALQATHEHLKQQKQALENLEEMLVIVHQDILYFDQDMDDMEERIIRLEYRPTKAETTTIEAQPLSSRVEMPLRRMRELRRRRRG